MIVVEEAGYIPRSYSSFKSILGITLPAIILNASAPAVTTIQTALLGQHGGASSQAAYASVMTTVRAVCLLFNFLVDGVSAKVGKAVGKRKWESMGLMVRLTFLMALVCSVAVAGSIAALREPIHMLIKVTPKVRAQADPFWNECILMGPLMIYEMAVSGLLQGYNRVNLQMGLSTVRSIFIVGCSVAVYTLPGMPLPASLESMGLIMIVGIFVSTSIGAVFVLFMRPPDAPKELPAPIVLVFFPSAASAALSEAGLSRAREPLLEQGSQDDASAPRPLSTVQEESDSALRSANGTSGAGSSAMAPASGGITKASRKASSASLVSMGSTMSVEEQEELFSFVRAGANMLVRSMTMQATFFIAMVVAGQMGTPYLAAHQVVSQFWQLNSYIVDGFATAGTVLGSRLSAHRAFDYGLRELRVLTWRLLGMAGTTGLVFGATFYICKEDVLSFFLSDHENKVRAILEGKLWLMVCLVQPVNALVYAYDGLVYAAHAFTTARNVVVAGFAVAFLPGVTAVKLALPGALWAVWLAKAGMNVVRLLGGAWRVHRHWLQPPGSTYLSVASP